MRNLLGAGARFWVRSVLILFLCVEFVFPYSVFGNTKGPGSIPVENRAFFSDPILELIEPFEMPKRSPLPIASPLLDLDPFFLRAQSWQSTDSGDRPENDPSNDVRFLAHPDRVDIAIDGVSGKLTLHQPLVPIASTPEWILLRAQDRSFFRAGGESGEGIFVISIQDFISASVKEKRVPIYFFPLPGEGWTGAASAALLPGENSVLLRANDGDVIPVDLNDIELAVKVGRANLVLAYALALGAKQKYKNAPEPAFPPSLSTAGFGVVFTGIHGEMPKASFVEVGLTSRQSFKQLARIVGLTYGLMPANAADWITIEQIIEQILPKLSHVGTIVGLSLVAGIVFKYTLYRSRFVEKEKTFHPWRNFYQRQSEAWKNNLTLFGHNVSFLATLPYVFPGNAIQFIADRFFPYLAAGENSRIRKLLNYFVGFATNMNRDLPVNDRVVRGALMTTAVDSFTVAYQLYSVVPNGLNSLAEAFPALGPRVDEILSKHNGMAATFALEETTYVTVNHLTHGPTDYASDVKAQAEQRATIEVDEEMKNDPKHENWEAERARRIEERRKVKFQEAGLGSESDFLFDAQTVYTALTAMLGYGASGMANQIQDRGKYVGQERYGLILPALQQAVAEAKVRVERFSQDAEAKAALELLQSLLRDATYFEQFIRNPRAILTELGNLVTGKAFLGRLKKARRELLLLTYAEALQSAQIRNLPESWLQNRTPGAARVAALLFQNSFFSLTSGERHLSEGFGDHPMFQGREGNRAKEEVRAAAFFALQTIYPDEFQRLLQEDDRAIVAYEKLKQNHPIEFQLLFERVGHLKWEHHAEATQEYQDPVKGWFSKWQVRRARISAEKAFVKKWGKKFSIPHSSVEERKSYQRLHADAMMRVMGIIPVYDSPDAPKLLEAVEQLAQSRFDEFIADHKVGRFIENHPRPSEFLEKMRAIFSAQAYLDITTKTNLVPASSPAQPGMMQRLRNCWVVRKLPGVMKWPLTMTMRFFEAATYAEGHHLGFGNWVKRSLPFLTDVKLGLIRTLQVSLIYLSAVWAFNYLFWHIEMPWYLHASSFFFGYPFVVGPRLFLQRAFKNIGLRPTHGIWAMGLYSLAYSWATFFGYFPTQFFEPETRQMTARLQAWLFGESAQAASSLQGAPAECAIELAAAASPPENPK